MVGLLVVVVVECFVERILMVDCVVGLVCWGSVVWLSLDIREEEEIGRVIGCCYIDITFDCPLP